MTNTATTAQTTTVGAFSFDSATSTVVGPADYMRSAEYARCIASIQNGTNHTFRAAVEHSPSFEIALLVVIQTDYAGWHGMQIFNRTRGLAR